MDSLDVAFCSPWCLEMEQLSLGEVVGAEQGPCWGHWCGRGGMHTQAGSRIKPHFKKAGRENSEVEAGSRVPGCRRAWLHRDL